MSLRFSIIVSVRNSGVGLKNCIESLKALDYPRQHFEIIIVSYNSTEVVVDAKISDGISYLNETQFQSLYAALNLGIQTAKGEFIAFIDSDCIVDRNWLKALDTASGDEAVGCLAGEILTLSHETVVERFSEEIALLRQRGPLSGWHFKPYAQIGNAIYRKTVFNRVGLFDPNINCGGDAAIAWRMLDTTKFTIRFVPQAIVYHAHRTSLAALYAQFQEYGMANMYWALAQPDYQPPAIKQLESEVINVFAKHLDTLQAAGVDDAILFSGLRAATQVAHLSGYLQDLLRYTTDACPTEKIPEIARERAPVCVICGSHSFVRGPGGRLFHGKLPQCFRCGSLERHRMLYSFLDEKWKQKHRLSCLCVGEGLPMAAAKSFASLRKVYLAGLAKEAHGHKHDIVLAMNVLEAAANIDLADILEQLVPALHEHSALLIYEPIKRVRAMHLDARIAELLPNVHVSSAPLLDKVTNDSGMLIILQPAAASSKSALKVSHARI
ncbi:glycosyltransferase [Methylocella sp. CPCC 101449]|uniref:glycosyltransferase n=1 Tax=Methylocella sp. CPCC 101449 TaxID=2987531 RepID=UPI00288C802C|nr:glycosyltransferase [Methylocella sp. CPCC 101449]MDT2019455.1 glycosyltransferase [Methylocella sp. CPCC 101449]